MYRGEDSASSIPCLREIQGEQSPQVFTPQIPAATTLSLSSTTPKMRTQGSL